MTGDAFEVVPPRLDGDWTALDRYGHDGLFGSQDAFRAPGLGFASLHAVGVEVLPEISEAMRQGDGSQRQAHIGRRAECIARKHAEATAVGGYRRADGDFHGEVRNQAVVFRAIERGESR